MLEMQTPGARLSGRRFVPAFAPAALADAWRPVAFHDARRRSGPGGHDHQTKLALTRSLAELLGVDYLGEVDAGRLGCESVLVVPADTLPSLAAAHAVGIVRPEHLFGGVVPYPFVATKVITHPLVRPDAAAPEGWSAAFGAAVGDVVLEGWSAFTAADAVEAGERLLGGGAVRIKEPGGIGGGGQHVVRTANELRARIAGLHPDELRRDGIVLERNLVEVVTRSVGQVRVGRWVASYVGTQQLVRNHRDHAVYGGSRLLVARGDYDALLSLGLDPAQHLAVEQALRYHEAALDCFPEMFVSRANYDVAQGTDEAGRACSGVLEQSWRIGGASGAELAALHAFRADPALGVVVASTHEVYGEDAVVPADARLNYDGRDDADLGRLRKYARVERDVDA